MKNLIKLYLLVCMVLTQANIYAHDTQPQPQPQTQKKLKVLIGANEIAPFSPKETQEGKYMETVVKGLALSNNTEITVVVPMMSGLYKKLIKEDGRSYEMVPMDGIIETNISIDVPMAWGKNGESYDLNVHLYEATTPEGVKIIFVGEPYHSGLFKTPEERELSDSDNAKNKKFFEKYSFLSKAILEIAKIENNYDIIHSFGFQTAFVPWYKKYWEKYSSIKAKTIHTTLASDIFTFNGPLKVTDGIKETLQIDEKYYDEFIDGSIREYNKVNFGKVLKAADEKTRSYFIEDVEQSLNEFSTLYYRYSEEYKVNKLLNNWSKKVLEGKGDEYILQNKEKFGDTDFLNGFIAKILGQKTTLSIARTDAGRIKHIAETLQNNGYSIDWGVQNQINSLLETITINLYNQKITNIMKYLKTKNIFSNKDAADYLIKNNTKILAMTQDYKNIMPIYDIPALRLAITAAYLFTFEDNGVFLSPQSYTMYMGTEKNEGIDGVLEELKSFSHIDAIQKYSMLSYLLVITNPANENIGSYYVKSDLEKTVPTTFSEILSSTALGKGFANNLIEIGSWDNINVVYSLECLKGLLPEKTKAIEKLKIVEGLIKR